MSQNDFGEPWRIEHKSQEVQSSWNSITNTPNMTTDAWQQVVDSRNIILAHDQPYNECSFSSDLLPRIVACVNYCRNLTNEQLSGEPHEAEAHQ